MVPDVTSGRNVPPTSVELGPQLQPAPHSKGVSIPNPTNLSLLLLPVSPQQNCLYVLLILHGTTWHFPRFTEKSSEAQSSKPPTEDHSETKGSNGTRTLAHQIHSHHNHGHEYSPDKCLPSISDDWQQCSGSGNQPAWDQTAAPLSTMEIYSVTCVLASAPSKKVPIRYFAQ